MPPIDIRPLRTLEELRACVSLQRETWGNEFTDVVPASILKVSQRVGGVVIYWTYDPLVARNAHLNFNVFGVRIHEYVEDMYGETESPLHRGIGTDRFVVAWPVP